MSEAEVVAQLVEFTNTLLAGISVLFTVVSAYIAALNYFIGGARFIARFFAFAFVSLILGLLTFVLIGAERTQAGLIARLREIGHDQGLTAAGRAVLANSTPATLLNGVMSVDDLVRAFGWTALAVIYLALAYMTFLHRWRPDVIPVSIAKSDTAT